MPVLRRRISSYSVYCVFMSIGPCRSIRRGDLHVPVVPLADEVRNPIHHSQPVVLFTFHTLGCEGDMCAIANLLQLLWAGAFGTLSTSPPTKLFDDSHSHTWRSYCRAPRGWRCFVPEWYLLCALGDSRWNEDVEVLRNQSTHQPEPLSLHAVTCAAVPPDSSGQHALNLEYEVWTKSRIDVKSFGARSTGKVLLTSNTILQLEHPWILWDPVQLIPPFLQDLNITRYGQTPRFCWTVLGCVHCCHSPALFPEAAFGDRCHFTSSVVQPQWIRGFEQRTWTIKLWAPGLQAWERIQPRSRFETCPMPIRQAFCYVCFVPSHLWSPSLFSTRYSHDCWA